MKLKTRRKLIVLTLVIIVLAPVIIVGVHSMDAKNNIASKELGNEYCNETKGHPQVAGEALTDWECKICGRKYTNSDTAVPILCDSCASITERCNICGLLKK